LGDLFNRIRCVEIEKLEDCILHHFEFEHISYSDNDTEPNHVVWLPVFRLIADKSDDYGSYKLAPITSLGLFVRHFLPFPILWDIPPQTTIAEYMQFLSVPPKSVEH